jgi:hypothetical protein
MLDFRGALMNLANSVSTLRDAYTTIRDNAGVAIDAAAKEPEYKHLIPLLEEMRETCLESFEQFYDAIPPEVAESMNAAQEFADA